MKTKKTKSEDTEMLNSISGSENLKLKDSLLEKNEHIKESNSLNKCESPIISKPTLVNDVEMAETLDSISSTHSARQSILMHTHDLEKHIVPNSIVLTQTFNESKKEEKDLSANLETSKLVIDNSDEEEENDYYDDEVPLVIDIYEDKQEESEQSLQSSNRPSVIVSRSQLHHCQHCDHISTSESEDIRHQNMHSSFTTCRICGTDIQWTAYGGHIVQHSELVDKNLLRCPKCPQTFTSEALLLAHFRMHINTLQFFCTECSHWFSQAIELKHHSLEVHRRLEHQPYHCYICFRRFSHSQAIINHMRLHTGETPFKCNECGRSFTQIGNLHRHLGVHRGVRPHKCSECGRAFADPATLRNHLRIHTGETPFVCNVCKRGFTQVGNLKRHMSKHLSERPHLCSQCGKGFAHESTLRNHKRTHTGEQPFKCTICDRAFSQVGNLKRHMAKHSSQQSFLCGGCGENFTNSRDLVRHNCSAKDKAPDDASNNSVVLLDKCASSSSWDSSEETSETKLLEQDSSHLSLTLKELMTSSQPQDETKNNGDRDLDTELNNTHSFACKTDTCGSKKWRIFPCPVCGKVYTWQHDLKIHFRIHSGEKPYKCDVCGRGFAQSGAVRIHKARHHPDADTSSIPVPSNNMPAFVTTPFTSLQVSS